MRETVTLTGIRLSVYYHLRQLCHVLFGCVRGVCVFGGRVVVTRTFTAWTQPEFMLETRFRYLIRSAKLCSVYSKLKQRSLVFYLFVFGY